MSKYSQFHRQIRLWGNYSYFWNQTFDQADEFTSQLKPASDVSVDAVMTSLYFNAVVFVILLASYEVLRRIFPSVYAARQLYGNHDELKRDSSHESTGLSHLPFETYVPFDWVGPVFGVPWSTVRKTAGLDAYFFLRFIRMCVRITAISTFWAFIILAPVYATGSHGASGWYHISMTNVEAGEWRMFIPVIFMYLFSAFIFFVMKQEFKHWMELRMDFLGRGDKMIDPQHHFSLMVENVPLELRSDSALFDYFDKLFPGKVHSASVIMNLPKLEAMSARRLRVARRLEKAIAVYHATGVRPTHTMGQRKFFVAGITIRIPSLACCKRDNAVHHVQVEGPYPPPGSKVDSISYYARDLAECNRELYFLQHRKSLVGQTGQVSRRESNWFVDLVDKATVAASTIMEDSVDDNDLRSPHDSLYYGSGDELLIYRADRMTSQYGSFGTPSASVPSSSPAAPRLATRKSARRNEQKDQDTVEKTVSFSPNITWTDSTDSDRATRLIFSDHLAKNDKEDGKIDDFVHPDARSKHKSFFRRIIGRLGLDFFVAGLKYLQRQLDVIVANVVGTTMSSTGFVTFLDLTSVTTAASTPLTHKPNLLKVNVAPEPRDIRWQSAHYPLRLLNRRELYANVFLTLGIVLWSVPLTAIQAFATAEQVARLPGMDWVLTFDGGSLTSFINGYLPVVALLGLIMLLPIIFERIAIHYEHRKTLSDVQRSMLGRYFYYQLANIYLTVTAGSFWNSIADIIDHPGNVLEILGTSLPKVVGYFISLLLTKILAGLPIVVLRVGALSRMLFLRSTFSAEKVTQRELDGIYRRDNLLYGWEYPSQLLVIVICFTYACICPVILPFGAVYFSVSLMVYKKQALYVYTSLYESGGAMFPDACDCVLFGLLCSQTVLIGYTVIRQCFYEPIWLMPLPFITLWVTRYFRRNYAVAAKHLSFERAVERDRLSDLKAKLKHEGIVMSPTMGFDERMERFDSKLYRQPVLTEAFLQPMPYRRHVKDAITQEVQHTVQRENRAAMMEIAHHDVMPHVIHEVPSNATGAEDSIHLNTSNTV